MHMRTSATQRSIDTTTIVTQKKTISRIPKITANIISILLFILMRILDTILRKVHLQYRQTLVLLPAISFPF